MCSCEIASLEIVPQNGVTVAFYDNGLMRNVARFTVSLSVVRTACRGLPFDLVVQNKGIKLGSHWIRVLSRRFNYQIGFDQGSGNYCGYSVSKSELVSLISYLQSL